MNNYKNGLKFIPRSIVIKFENEKIVLKFENK